MSASFRKKSWIVFKLKGFSKPNIIENSVQITENNSTKIGQKKKREKKKKCINITAFLCICLWVLADILRT